MKEATGSTLNRGKTRLPLFGSEQIENLVENLTVYGVLFTNGHYRESLKANESAMTAKAMRKN